MVDLCRNHGDEAEARCRLAAGSGRQAVARDGQVATAERRRSPGDPSGDRQQRLFQEADDPAPGAVRESAAVVGSQLGQSACSFNR